MSETGKTIALIKALSGGGGLPPVTASDNGKVLTVENGEWTADSNLFVVALSGSPLKSDKTYAEIVAAVDAGRTVIAQQDSTLLQFAGYTSTAVEFVKFTANGATVMKRAVLKNGNLNAYSTSTVPASFAADDGSELIVRNGAWTKQQKKFIVTLTPTSADYSGTMDKTVAEINAAYEAGQQIVFRIYGSPTLYYDINATLSRKVDSDDVPSFGGYGILTGQFIVFETTTNTLESTYSTTIYTLTPAT